MEISIMETYIIDDHIVTCMKMDENLWLGQRSWSYDIKIAKEGKYPAYMSMIMTDDNASIDLNQYEPSGKYVTNHAYKGFLRAMIAAKKKNYKFRILYKRVMATHFNVCNGRFHIHTDGKLNTYSFPFKTSVH